MKTLFVNALQRLEDKSPLTLVCVVDSENSTPQSQGAVMLVGKDGRIAGTVGGGALEAACVQEAIRCIHKKKSCDKTFDLRPSSADGLDMVCGGTMRVWFQWMDPSDPRWAALFKVAIAQLDKPDRETKMWLVFELTREFPSIVDEYGKSIYGYDLTGDFPLRPNLCLLWGLHFFLPLRPRERAVIFGGGHCAQALVPILASVGFRVTVFEDRPAYAVPALFPGAESVVCGSYDNAGKITGIGYTDYAVIMTDSHKHDLTVQRQCLSSSITYLGVLGSRKKAKLLRWKLRDEGKPDLYLNAVHSPAGIEIFAVTPQEIAVSIAAEMIRVRARLREGKNSTLNSAHKYTGPVPSMCDIPDPTPDQPPAQTSSQPSAQAPGQAAGPDGR